MSASANKPMGQGGRQYHIGLAPGEVAPRIMLVGDPARARKVADHFDTTAFMRTEREYLTFTGVYEGLDLTVMATGMGADNTEIAMVELAALVEEPTILRVGTCGSLQPGIKVGDLVVSKGALRLESTTLGWVEEGYPALAHHEMIMAVSAAARRTGATVHEGITATACGFYGGQGRTVAGIKPRDEQLLDRLVNQGISNMEMEVSAVLTLASLFGARAGAICAVLAERGVDRFIEPQEKILVEERAIMAGLQTFKLLEALDAKGGAAGLCDALINAAAKDSDAS